MLEQDLLERLLPVRRLRSRPRLGERKMSNYHLKQTQHRSSWPQPTRTGPQVVLIDKTPTRKPVRTALHLDHVLSLDPSVPALASLPPSHIAERVSRDEPWSIRSVDLRGRECRRDLGAISGDRPSGSGGSSNEARYLVLPAHAEVAPESRPFRAPRGPARRVCRSLFTASWRRSRTRTSGRRRLRTRRSTRAPGLGSGRRTARSGSSASGSTGRSQWMRGRKGRR